MTTLIATPDNATGSVKLDIDRTAAVTKVVRSNVNGIEEVRAATGQLPTDGEDGTLILSDYEAAHGTNIYNVYLGPETLYNYVRNPRGLSETNFAMYSAGTGETGTTTFLTGRSDGPAGVPVTTYARRSITAAKTGGSTGWTSLNTNQRNPIDGVAGDSVTASVYIRYTGSAPTFSINMRTAVYSGTTLASFKDQYAITLNSGQWVRLDATVVATTTFDAAGFWAWSSSTVIMAAGSTVDVTAALIQKSETVGDYFDGSTPNVTDVVHAWDGTANASRSKKTTSNIVVTQSATLTIDKPWLSIPVMPQFSEQVETITEFDSGREADMTVHRPLGRSDSIVVMGKLGDRTGSLEVFCKSYADARRLERVFTRGEVVQLRQTVPEMDMYFTASSIPVSPYQVEGPDATRWALQINYIEVRRPIGNLAGALGWTFTAVAESFDSFNQLSESFASFDDLTLGDAIV